MRKIFFATAAVALLLSACKQQPAPLSPAETLIQRLDSLQHGPIMYGHQDDPFYGVSWQWEKDRSDTYELVGDYPAVMGIDWGGLEEHHCKKPRFCSFQLDSRRGYSSCRARGNHHL